MKIISEWYFNSSKERWIHKFYDFSKMNNPIHGSSYFIAFLYCYQICQKCHTKKLWLGTVWSHNFGFFVQSQVNFAPFIIDLHCWPLIFHISRNYKTFSFVDLVTLTLLDRIQEISKQKYLRARLNLLQCCQTFWIKFVGISVLND